MLAKSRFWYFMKKLNKAKSDGELLGLNEIFEKKPLQVNNYGIWLCYQSRTNTHNMYKDYRDVTVCHMYQEMAGRHRARPDTIQIINTAILKPKQCRCEQVKEMHNTKLKFPVICKAPTDGRSAPSSSPKSSKTMEVTPNCSCARTRTTTSLPKSVATSSLTMAVTPHCSVAMRTRA